MFRFVRSNAKTEISCSWLRQSRLVLFETLKTVDGCKYVRELGTDPIQIPNERNSSKNSRMQRQELKIKVFYKKVKIILPKTPNQVLAFERLKQVVLLVLFVWYVAQWLPIRCIRFWHFNQLLWELMCLSKFCWRFSKRMRFTFRFYFH